VHDAADDAAIIHSLDAPDVCRQMRFNPLPLLIAQPKQVSARSQILFQKRIRSALSEGKINEF
jgi:hypothetical protein